MTSQPTDSPPPRPNPRGLGASFGFAFDGVLRTLVGERNMKIHWISGLAVMLVGMALPLPMSARAALLFAVLLVLATEVLNAAVEGLVNLATETWAFSAKLAKDAAAGMVLVMALGAVLILWDVLLHQWPTVQASTGAISRTLFLGVPLLAALSALLLVPRSRALVVWAAGGVAVACWLPLAWASEDPVFTLASALLVGGAGWGRWREPSLLSRSPPHR